MKQIFSEFTHNENITKFWNFVKIYGSRIVLFLKCIFPYKYQSGNGIIGPNDINGQEMENNYDY